MEGTRAKAWKQPGKPSSFVAIFGRKKKIVQQKLCYVYNSPDMLWLGKSQLIEMLPIFFAQTVLAHLILVLLEVDSIVKFVLLCGFQGLWRDVVEMHVWKALSQSCFFYLSLCLYEYRERYGDIRIHIYIYLCCSIKLSCIPCPVVIDVYLYRIITTFLLLWYIFCIV